MKKAELENLLNDIISKIKTPDYEVKKIVLGLNYAINNFDNLSKLHKKRLPELIEEAKALTNI